ncbi:MAG TPA: energy-coupling factor transporter transmembrane component T [Candidatus Deferrimicrobium sp.]|nr:energy-coupling factor transporter transmembrane component T [Candidatus Deferrimicrobium sp.]
MLSDLRVGQYIHGKSLLHQLDPRTKLWCLMVLSMASFMLETWLGIGAISLVLLTLMKLSQVQLKWHLSSIKVIWPVLVLTLLLNAFSIPGTTLFGIGSLILTTEGLKAGLLLAVRIVLIILITSLFSFTTSPIKLSGGVESLLKPFNKLGLPGAELALMMSIALRFIPTIVEEGERLLRAAQARGGDLTSGNLLKRARSLTPLLIPLFLGSFRRADELALAMEARGYQVGGRRTSFHELKLQSMDYWVLLFSSISFLALIGTRFI